jgi:hypothetical protein
MVAYHRCKIVTMLDITSRNQVARALPDIADVARMA